MIFKLLGFFNVTFNALLLFLIFCEYFFLSFCMVTRETKSAYSTSDNKESCIIVNYAGSSVAAAWSGRYNYYQVVEIRGIMEGDGSRAGTKYLVLFFLTHFLLQKLNATITL